MQFSHPNEQGGMGEMSPYARPYSGKRRSRGCLLGVLLIVVVVGSGLGFWFWRTHLGVTLSVRAHPTIRIATACVGAAVIQAGPTNQVTFTGDIPSYTQNSSTDTIELGDPCGNLTITVPPVTNLDLFATEGITVHGVSGTLNLGTSSGSRIDLEQVTLEGQSKIDADAGTGDASNSSGGPIVFSGSLAPGSATTVTDQSDTINITLSTDTSCQLDISGWPTTITSNIPGVQKPANQITDILANIGSNPSAAKLTLEAFDTAVILNKGP